MERRSIVPTSCGFTVESATRSWSTTTATSQSPARKRLKEQVKKSVSRQIICNLMKLAHQVFCCQTVSSLRRCLPKCPHQPIKLKVKVFRRQVDFPNSPQTAKKIQTKAFSRVQKLHFCKCVFRRVKKLVSPPRLLCYSFLCK